MMGNNWSEFFHSNDHMGSKIISHLDDCSLSRTAQVNKAWKQVTDQVRSERLDHEKQQLYSLILYCTNAEPNEVQRAHDRIDRFLKIGTEKGEQTTPIVESLKSL